MTWLFEGKEVDSIPDEYVGFVYCITNLVNGKKYIGKKLAKFTKTKYKMVTQKNGIKKRKKLRELIDSDWRDYYGSSDALKSDIDSLGEENFNREIICFCKSKAECSYIEARTQMDMRVLESDQFYNGHIMVRVHKSHIVGKV